MKLTYSVSAFMILLFSSLMALSVYHIHASTPSTSPSNSPTLPNLTLRDVKSITVVGGCGGTTCQPSHSLNLDNSTDQQTAQHLLKWIHSSKNVHYDYQVPTSNGGAPPELDLSLKNDESIQISLAPAHDYYINRIMRATSIPLTHWMKQTFSSMIPTQSISLAANRQLLTIDFISKDEGWMTALDKNNQKQLGQGDDASMIQFVSKHSIWTLGNIGGAAGSESATLYHSIDGGIHWTTAAKTTRQSKADALPFYGDKSGITFINDKTGWVTGFENGGFYSERAQNSGKSWNHQTGTIPSHPFWLSAILINYNSFSRNVLNNE